MWFQAIFYPSGQSIRRLRKDAQALLALQSFPCFCFFLTRTHGVCQRSSVAAGGFGGLNLPEQSLKPPLQIDIWKTINQWSFMSNFRTSTPPPWTNDQPPLLKTSWRRFCGSVCMAEDCERICTSHARVGRKLKFRKSGHSHALRGGGLCGPGSFFLFFFAETFRSFWSLRHFGQSYHSSIEIYRNNIHLVIFLTELTNFFRSFWSMT